MKWYILLVALILPVIALAQEWVARYNGPADESDWARAIAVDGNGNVYVTGSSMGSGTDYDYATIKYSAAGVEEKPNIRKQKATMSMHPNPFTGSTIIRLEDLKDEDTGVQVYDVMGRLVDETSGRIIAKNLLHGIYFIRVKGYESIKI